jgi:SAM-dependent methyltransferase
MKKMEFNKNFFYPYLKEAPLALALERTIECNIYKSLDMPKPVLDIGCGEGMYAKLLFKSKVDVGIDPNPKELEKAKEYDAYEELICCYGDKIPKPDKSFNTIFSNSVLEHIPDLLPVLKEAHRLLADDGKFYVTIPTDYFEQNSMVAKVLTFLGLKKIELKYRKFFNSFWQHYHCYSTDGWEKMFQQAGFKVTRFQTYCNTKTGLFNDFFSPIAILSFFQKKLFNKWFIIKPLRIPFAMVYAVLYSPMMKEKYNTSSDGLVFFELSK